MNSTALEAKKEKISFISEAHEKFYYEKIQKVIYDEKSVVLWTRKSIG